MQGESGVRGETNTIYILYKFHASGMIETYHLQQSKSKGGKKGREDSEALTQSAALPSLAHKVESSYTSKYVAHHVVKISEVYLLGYHH